MPPKARTAAHFPVVLRFFDDGGQELHATQLLHSTAKLSAPLRLFVGRFARHWHRGAPDAVDVEDLEASDAQGVLSLDVAIGNLLDPLIDASSQTLEIQLRRRRPCTAENDAARRIEATSTDAAADGAAEAAERAPELRGYDLPPPNGILCSKGEFDDLLARAPENVVIVVSFEHCAAAEGKAAQAYHRLADRLWPKAVLVRSDLDDNEPLARACGVDRSPTLVFFKNRAALGKLFDANEMQICKLLLNEADDPPVKARQHRDSWGEGLLKDR